MDRLECPHCGKRDFDSDWIYNNNLYDPDTQMKIKCPKCNESFWVQTWSSIGYKCAKTADEL